MSPLNHLCAGNQSRKIWRPSGASRNITAAFWPFHVATPGDGQCEVGISRGHFYGIGCFYWGKSSFSPAWERPSRVPAGTDNACPHPKPSLSPTGHSPGLRPPSPEPTGEGAGLLPLGERQGKVQKSKGQNPRKFQIRNSKSKLSGVRHKLVTNRRSTLFVHPTVSSIPGEYPAHPRSITTDSGDQKASRLRPRCRHECDRSGPGRIDDNCKQHTFRW